MATLTALYTRLILDLNRDDMGSGGELEQAKIDAVADAVEFHSDEQFWFNRASGTGNTTASDATLTMPSGIRVASVVAYNGAELQKVALETIEHKTETGLPTHWAENEGAIQLWPIPDATYSLSVFGLASTGVPASGGDSNIWTTEAYNLILSAAKKILCRGPLRDPEGYALAIEAEQEALGRLRRESRRRNRQGLTTDIAIPTQFNIVTG